MRAKLNGSIKFRPVVCVFSSVLISLLAACSNEDQRAVSALVKDQLSGARDVRTGKVIVYRLRDRKFACVTVASRNIFGESQPDQIFTAFYIAEYNEWNVGGFEPAAGYSCDGIVKAAHNAKPPPPVGTPAPTIVVPKIAQPELRSAVPPGSDFDNSGHSARPSNSAITQVGLGLSKNYENCLNSGDAASGFPAAILDCADAEEKWQQARLREAYNEALSRLPSDRLNELRNSEKDWLEVRDSTCKATSPSSDIGASGPSIYDQCIAQQDAARITALSAAK